MKRLLIIYCLTMLSGCVSVNVIPLGGAKFFPTNKKVLVEHGNKGYTECYSKVQFSENLRPGSLVDTYILSSNSDGLEGRLL